MKTGYPTFITRCLVLTGLLIPLLAGAQQEISCAENLKRAREQLFDKGQVEQVAGLINNCLRSGFKKE
jgi:hypothetical protein